EVTLTDALEDWARSYRAVFANYPSLIPMIAITPVSDAPQTLRMYNVVAQAIMSAGIPDDAVIRVIVSFESFLFGSALDVNAPSDVLDAGEQSTDSAWLKQAIGAAQAPSEQQQSTRPHAEALGEVRNAYAEPPFQYGLAALIRQTLNLLKSASNSDRRDLGGSGATWLRWYRARQRLVHRRSRTRRAQLRDHPHRWTLQQYRMTQPAQ